ncbi:MAG: endolytic transglycosylase MltG [Phenylobacterium sp.]|uniref:endolytic transglycosylase MltG n=1 Tax=Phenylobacterium sp. TaxID=1871053 RepID=UPI001229291C|nr:endolytic transglycosylase MltG [Phenylobacterium sp.]TAJ73855.1 MAG: endolytic transglycosylase MltG [Phenylobacterium sp.]
MSRRRISKRAAGGGALIALGLAILVALAGVWSYVGPGPKARSGETTVVVLERGSGVGQIGHTLRTAGVISSAGFFALAARMTGAAADLKAGEYEIRSGASMARVLADIRAGKVVRRVITIPEGWTSGMALDAVNASPVLTGTAEEPPEGSLLPDTYDIQRGEPRAAVLQRMRDAHDKVLAQLWASRQPGLPLNSPQEAVTLASIVEKETGVPAERPRVAAIFINRLRAGMLLQSDPTIIYGLTKGRPLGRGIRASELAADSPWNSYKVAGLPPGPIANPGRDALAAVLDPPKTDELYFVADGSGGHAFASTYDEHARNVERWRAIERQRATGGQ